MPAGLLDQIGFFVGIIITILGLSYILGDNALFRTAIHGFIGVSAGFVAIVIFRYVILPQLIIPLSGDSLGARNLAILFLIPGALLLTKISPKLGFLGNPVVAAMVGIAAAVAVGGALTGTLFPQIGVTIELFNVKTLGSNPQSAFINLVNAGIILIGTISTLTYFHFGLRKKKGRETKRLVWIEGVGRVGQLFIGISLGVIFSGVYRASLVALVERLSYLWESINILIEPYI